LPVTIDLVLVPGLFLLGYLVIIVIESIVRRVPLGTELAQRLGAIFLGSFFLLSCLAVGGLLTWLADAFLPTRILNGLETMGINADLDTGFKPVHLHGNSIAIATLIVGLVFFFNRIRKSPETKRPVQLTREQRMTPYQRMLQERQVPERPRPQPKQRPATQALCNNQPLLSLQPEAVNYRPM